MPQPLPRAKTTQQAYRRRLPHYQPPGAALFVTFATWNRWQLPEDARSIVLECCLHWHETKFSMHALVVMPDHVHLLLTPGRDESGAFFGLSEILHQVKGVAAHKINKRLGRTGRVWQPESFDQALRRDEGIRQKAEYICANPVRAGLVPREDDYPWLWREWVEGAR